MAEYRVGLDIGNSGFKMAGRIGNDFRLQNIKALATFDATDSPYGVKLDGDTREIYFGVGDPLVAQDKTKRPYLKQILLLAITSMYGEVTDCEKVKVGIGLPLTDYKEEHKRKKYQDELSKIRQLSGYVNGKYYVYNTEIRVFAEGFSAFYSLMPTLSKSYRWLIVDNGYRTTDVVGVSFDSAKNKWFVDNNFGIEKGLLEMYTNIAETYSYQVGQKKYNPEDVEYYMRENIILMTDNPDIPEANLNDYSYGAVAPIEFIYNQIGLKFNDIDARKILLLGGGAELVNKHLNRANKQYEPDFNKRLYSNAIGFYLQLR